MDYSQVTGYKVKIKSPFLSKTPAVKSGVKQSIIYICNTKSEILVRV